MIVPDANLLLYAYDSESPFHRAAARWWSALLSGAEPVGLCPVVVFAFLRSGRAEQRREAQCGQPQRKHTQEPKLR